MNDPTNEEIQAYLGAAPSASPGGSPSRSRFIEPSGGGDPTQDEINAYLGVDPKQQQDPPVSDNPHTDAALADTETLLQQLTRVGKSVAPQIKQSAAQMLTRANQLARAPSWPWIRPFERTVRQVATTPALPSSQQMQAIRERMGIPDQPAAGSRLMSAIYDPIAEQATLQNAALAASWVQPEIGAALTSAYLAPSVNPAWQQIKHLPQATPEEGLKLGEQIWPLLFAPFIHGPKPDFVPVVPPRRFINAPYVQPDEPLGGQVHPPELPIQTQKMLADTGGLFTDEALSKHFPDHELDELKAAGVVSDAPGGLYTVNQPGTPPPPKVSGAVVEQQVAKEKAEGPPEDDTSGPVAIPKTKQTPEELEDDARFRLEEVQTRLANYGVEPIDTTGMDTDRAARVLEDQEHNIPYAERHDALRTGKTIQENRIARQLRARWTEQQSGRYGSTDLNRQAESIPRFDVTKQPEGGFRIRSSPYTEMVEVPAEGKGAKPTFRRRTVPAADLFLNREGGELQPYASRERSTEKVGVRGERGKVGQETPLRQPGETTQTGEEPGSTGERTVAAETPPTAPDAPRYVVRETSKGAVVKDLETNQNVASFQSKELHPDPGELADLRAKAGEHAREKIAEELKNKAKETEPPKEEDPTLSEINPADIAQAQSLGLHGQDLMDHLKRAAQMRRARLAGQGGRGAITTGPETPRAAPDVAGQGGDRPGVGGTPGGGRGTPEPGTEGVGGAGVGGPGVKGIPGKGTPGTPIAGPPKGRTWIRRQTQPMRYQHRDEPDLWLEKNADKGGYDAVDYRGNQRKVIDHFADPDARGKAQAAFAHGKFTRGEAEPGGTQETPARVLSGIDLSEVSGFEEAFQKIHKRPPTPEEKIKLKPIADQYKAAKAASASKTSQAIAKVVDHYKNVKDIPIDEAVAQVKDAIEQAVKPCK